jgi:hypothetical protein
MTSVRTTRFRTLAPFLGAALALGSAGAVATAPTAAAAPAPSACDTSQRLVVCEYTSIGESTFVVPPSVRRIAVLAIGGGGGKSESAAGGFGDQVTDSIGVFAGAVLYINVGGAAYGTGCADTRDECQGGYGEGGFSSSGGGGGGASDIRTESASQPNSLDSRLLVAGGGGGAGGSGSNGVGGAGGNAGATGAAGGGASPGGGGSPGSQEAAGTGGSPNGTDGFLDKGGSTLANGGAGAGGYFGGGSGGSTQGGGGGGGGGSSIAATGRGTMSVATQREGRVQIRYAVADTGAPNLTLTIPNLTLEATSADGAVVTYTASAVDDVDGVVPVTCTPESGSTIPIGDTFVTCEARDVSGNSSLESRRVQVVDTTPPSLALPGQVTASATGPSGAQVTYSAAATDLVDGSVAPACTPASQTVFPLGRTAVTCTATDTRGNSATGTFNVVVTDTSAPTVAVPSPITTEATSAAGAVVTYPAATATDDVDGNLTPVCQPASGSTFALGTTTVTCTATDQAGNTGSAPFTVTVLDRTAPVVTVPGPIQREATGPTGAAVTFTATASDTVSGALSPTCTPASGSTFAIGTKTVSCIATDAAGNTGSATFQVTVVDTTAPTLTVPANITVAATSASGATVSYATSATDLVDGSRPVSCSKASATVFPVGTTTVTCTAADTRGNTVTKTITVTVQPYRADLKVAVSGPASVVRGGAATYTVTVTNLGTSTATNVRAVLTVAGLSVTGTTPSTSSGSVKVQGVTYTGALWTVASIPAGGSVTFTVTGTVTVKKGDAVTAVGATTSDVPDAVLSNNVATVKSTVTR